MDKNETKTKELEARKNKIAALKAEHGDVYSYKTSDNKEAFFKVPSRKILGFASAESQGDSLKYKDIIARNCFLDGDRDILDQDKYFIGFAGRILEMVEVVEGELEKL